MHLICRKTNQNRETIFQVKFTTRISLFFSAPGSYDVEKSEKIIHQSSGAITFGIKYKEQKPDDIPGKS